MNYKYIRKKYDSGLQREEVRRFYENKYFSLFVSHYKCDELSEEQLRYVLTQFWSQGQVLAFILPESEKSSEYDFLSNSTTATIDKDNEKLIIFTPFETTQFNINNASTIVRAINTRGARFIPETPFINNKTAVVGFAHASHRPILALIKTLIDKLVEVEMTINTNLFSHKLPRLITVSPEDEIKRKEIVDSLLNDVPVLFLDSEDTSSISSVISGGDYIIDKLYKYKLDVENEVLTILGIDNVGQEKQERLLTDEVNSNNDLISYNAHCFLDTMNEFAYRVEKTLNFKMKFYIDPIAEEISEEVREDEEKEIMEND